MERGEGIEDPTSDVVELLLRRGTAEGLEPIFEALPTLELHDHVGRGVGLEHAGYAHDARVLETGEHPRFLEKARAPPLEKVALVPGARAHGQSRVPASDLGWVIFLDRDDSLESDIVCFVGDAEAAGPDHARDAELAEENSVGR